MYPTRCYIMSLLSLSIASFFLLRSMENIAAIKIIKQTARHQAERITDHIVYLCVSEVHRILQHLDQDGERNARSDQDDRRLLRRHAKRTAAEHTERDEQHDIQHHRHKDDRIAERTKQQAQRYDRHRIGQRGTMDQRPPRYQQDRYPEDRTVDEPIEQLMPIQMILDQRPNGNERR